MRKASSTKGARLGIVPLSILKRSTSRHPAYWDAGEQGDNMSIPLDHAERILSRAVGVNAAFAVASIGLTSTRKWRRACDRSPNEVCRPAPVRLPFATLAPCLNNGDKCERPYVGCIVIAGSGRIFRRRSRSACTSTAREQLTSRLRRMIGS